MIKKLTIYVTLVLCVTSVFAQQKDVSNNQAAKLLIQKVVTKTGNYDLLKKLKDVEFDYTFYSPQYDKKDISKERYIFDGEVSWGSYETHDVYVMPGKKEKVIQFYDGKNSTVMTLGEESITDQKVLRSAAFLRKANFYWFAMMPKLLDNGITYEQLDDRTHNTIRYKIVKIGFNQGVGEVQDDFILYINPETFLIDRFLFTVKGSGLGILLMEAQYETVNGYTFMANRKVIAGANWEDSVKGHLLFEQMTDNVKFNNGFIKEMLQKNMK